MSRSRCGYAASSTVTIRRPRASHASRSRCACSTGACTCGSEKRASALGWSDSARALPWKATSDAIWCQLTDFGLARSRASSARALSDQPSDEALFSDPHVQASVEQAHRDLDAWEARGLRMVTVLDAAYPQRLLDIRETPRQ